MMKDRIISIKLRNGHFALVQMITEGQIAVFNCFQTVNEWNLRLTTDKVLFIGVVSRSVLSRSTISIQKNVTPLVGLKCPDYQIDIGDGFRTVKLWQGTEDEREFLMMGKRQNSLRHVRHDNDQIREEYTQIALEDFDKYKGVELTNIYDYPSFNERLLLCELFGRNVDPLKEIAFDRYLPREYRTYVDVISGKIPLRDLGY